MVGTVLPVSSRVGEGVQVDAADAALPVGAQPDPDLHLMAGAAGGLGFLPGVDQLGGAPGLEGDESGIHLAHGCLLGPEATADAGLLHPDAAFGDAQGMGQNPPHMKDDLGGGTPRAAVRRGPARCRCGTFPSWPD